MIRKIVILVIAIIVMFVIMPTISLADTNTGGVVTLDNEDGDINPGELKSRVESTGITNTSEVLELHIGTDVSGEFNDTDIAYINTMINLEILDVASTITVGNVGDNFCNSNSTTNFDNLQEVTFPATTFGSNAFRMCSSLSSISLPNAKTFGSIAFSACSSLSSISLPNAKTFGNYVFTRCTSLTEVSLPNATIFGDYICYECTSLTTVSLPNAATFGSKAFYGCSLLGSITLPNATTFGSHMCFRCTSLTTLDLPNATTFGSNMCYQCTSLTTVSLPNATTFEYDAFEYCTALTTVSLPNATSFGDFMCFGCTSLTTVSLPNVTTFEDNAFSRCTSLTTVSLPNVTTFGDYMFHGCTSLSTVDLPNATTFGSCAFRHCSSLESISLPNATTFGNYMFLNCTSLTTVDLPNATTFGDEAFYGSSELVSLTLGYNPPSVNTIAADILPCNLYVPRSAVSLYKEDNDGNTNDNMWHGLTINIIFYTVEFDSQSGSLVSSQNINYDDYATKPTNPTRDNYTFGGWYTDSVCTDDNPWNFNLCSVNNDMTLYAKWISNSISDLEFNISYKALRLSVTDSVETVCPYSFYPANVIDSTVLWESSNPSVASISNGMITANSEGRTVITITANDTTNGTIKTTMMLEVMDSSTTGLSSDKTNIIGNVVDSNGVSLSNILVTTYSDPMDTLTDTVSGAFSYSSVPFTHHTMVISDDNGIEIGRFTLNFNNTGNENISIDNTNKVANINFDDSTYLVDFTIQINDTFTNINIINSDIAGQEIYINPKTGDYTSNYLWMLLLLPLFILTYISIKKFNKHVVIS